MVEIHENNIILVKTNYKEVKDSLKAIFLLRKRVKKIYIGGKNYFDFDTKYYHKFSEDEMAKIEKRYNRNWYLDNEITLKKGRMYDKITGVVLPQPTEETIIIVEFE